MRSAAGDSNPRAYSDSDERAASTLYPAFAQEQMMTIRRLPIDQSTKYPFVLDDVLNGTQDFRWCRRDDGRYCGVLAGHHIHMRQCGDVLEYRSSPDIDLTDLLHSYFRLDDDIDCIYDYISSRCKKINQLVKECPSLRIMRQPDPWECMVAYICSRRVTPPRIAERVERIAEKLGDKVELNGDVRYTFPVPKKFLNAGEEVLADLKLGLQDVPGYIIAAAKRICDGGLDLAGLDQLPYGEARLQLMGCKGVGSKIADCVALFSLGKTEAFPVDSRVRKAVATQYFPWLEKQLEKQSDKSKFDDSIVIWAQERFGKYAGYVNQLLYMDSGSSRQRRKLSCNPHLL